MADIAKSDVAMTELQSGGGQHNHQQLAFHPPRPESNVVRKSYQMRALVRKTLSYQKRQCCTNCCCIALCPCMMVGISGVIAIVVTALLARASPSNNIIYCANSASLDSTGVPYFNTFYVDQFPKDNSGNYLANFFKIAQDFFAKSNNGGPPIDASYVPHLCVNNFNTPYNFTTPYELNPGVSNSSFADRSSVYSPDLSGGWLDLNSTSKISIVDQTQTYPWYFVVNDDATAAISGNLSQPVSIPLASLGNFSSIDAAVNAARSGFWGNLTSQPRYYLSVDSSGLHGLTSVPFINAFSGSDDDLDNLMGSLVANAVSALAALPNKGDILSSDPVAYARYTLSANEVSKSLPYGAIRVKSGDLNNVQYTYYLFTGNDRRISNSVPGFPSKGFRQILQIAQMTQAALAAVQPGVTITQTLRSMPSLYNTAVSIPVGSIIGGILYPFGISFLFPIFVLTLVKEKEDRILVMMRMNGLQSWTYYVTHYIHFYTLHVVCSAVYIITGHVFRMQFFTQTDPGVYILLLFMWGHAQIAMAFFFTALFNKSRGAFVTCFALVLIAVIINIVTTNIFGDAAPRLYFIYPPFAFYRALAVINQASYLNGVPRYKISFLKGDDEVFVCIIFLLVEIIVLFVLSMYLTAILPSEYGVQRPWHFPFTDTYSWLRKKWLKSQNRGEQEPEEQVLAAQVIEIDEEEIQFEDEDVKRERERIYRGDFGQDNPLIMRDMRKAYGNSYVAVKSMTLGIEKDLVFGLLGPNGAGKTTLISILTGLYRPTSGEAWLAGYNINTNMRDVYMNMGVCPQHDIHWDDLTVEEHLYFYARIKGIPPRQEKAVVQRALEAVSLQRFATRLAKGLSGGEKRRLSIAIALTGDCKVVFLDEPTTGLDPEVRRLIWNIITAAKVNRTIILTTHSLEECEVLCQRVGIMAKGTMRCLGSQLHLKNKYGSGFKITLACSPARLQEATGFVESILPKGWRKLDAFAGNASYEFALSDGVTVSSLFELMEENKSKIGIFDWGLSQTSLEEVFLRIIRESDSEAD